MVRAFLLSLVSIVLGTIHYIVLDTLQLQSSESAVREFISWTLAGAIISFYIQAWAKVRFSLWKYAVVAFPLPLYNIVRYMRIHEQLQSFSGLMEDFAKSINSIVGFTGIGHIVFHTTFLAMVFALRRFRVGPSGEVGLTR